MKHKGLCQIPRAKERYSKKLMTKQYTISFSRIPAKFIYNK